MKLDEIICKRVLIFGVISNLIFGPHNLLFGLTRNDRLYIWIGAISTFMGILALATYLICKMKELTTDEETKG